MAIFKGAGVAIVTPMKDNLEVNYDKLDEILEEQIAGKTDSIVICGTTGESATLSEEEHLEAIRFTIERVNHRIPVLHILTFESGGNDLNSLCRVVFHLSQSTGGLVSGPF